MASQDYLEACLRIQLRNLRMIAPSSVVAMVELYHINNPGQYSDPTYDSYRMNHAPTGYLSQSRPRNSWDTHQEQFYLNMFGHAARNSYPGENSTIIPPHATPSLNPQATHHQDIDHHLIADEWGYDYSIYDFHDDAGEFENWDRLSDDVQETATIPDSVVDANSSRDEEIYRYLKTRRSREEDDVESSICVVCQDSLYENENNDDENIATLNCGHEYHAHCIKCWLQQKNVCPLCNAVVLPQR